MKIYRITKWSDARGAISRTVGAIRNWLQPRLNGTIDAQIRANDVLVFRKTNVSEISPPIVQRNRLHSFGRYIFQPHKHKRLGQF